MKRTTMLVNHGEMASKQHWRLTSTARATGMPRAVHPSDSTWFWPRSVEVFWSRPCKACSSIWFHLLSRTSRRRCPANPQGPRPVRTKMVSGGIKAMRGDQAAYPVFKHCLLQIWRSLEVSRDLNHDSIHCRCVRHLRRNWDVVSTLLVTVRCESTDFCGWFHER